MGFLNFLMLLMFGSCMIGVFALMTGGAVFGSTVGIICLVICIFFGCPYFEE